MNELRLTYDSNFKTSKVAVQNIYQYSNTKIIILLAGIITGEPFYNWITPGGVQLSQRGLFRSPQFDVDGCIAYSAMIYPGMTAGISNGNDVGAARFSLEIGNTKYPWIKIPVDKTILPEQTDFIPSNYLEILDKINHLTAEITTLKGRVAALEAK